MAHAMVGTGSNGHVDETGVGGDGDDAGDSPDSGDVGAPSALKDSDQFQTPPCVFEPLHNKYLFTRDLAASDLNKLIAIYVTPDSEFESGRGSLHCRWRDHAGWDWLNPPYSRGNLEAFTAKARAEVQGGWAGVMLVPATPGAGWFQKNVLRGHDVLGGGSTNPGSGVWIQGYDLRLGGNGYQLTVRFLKRRIPFWKDGAPMPKNAGAKTDSCLIEWRPRRLL